MNKHVWEWQWSRSLVVSSVNWRYWLLGQGDDVDIHIIMANLWSMLVGFGLAVVLSCAWDHGQGFRHVPAWAWIISGLLMSPFVWLMVISAVWVLRITWTVTKWIAMRPVKIGKWLIAHPPVKRVPLAESRVGLEKLQKVREIETAVGEDPYPLF